MPSFQPVIDLIIGLAEDCAKEPRDIAPPAFDKAAVKARILEVAGADVKAAYSILVKQERYAAVGAAKDKAKAALKEEFAPEAISEMFKEVEADVLRGAVLDTGKRIDGRDHGRYPCARSWPRWASCPAPTARPCSPAVRRRRWSSPRWAPGRMSRSSTPWRANTARSFMLHYNFPPYSRVKPVRMGTPGPPRDRPWQAGLARAAPAAAGARKSSPTRCAWCRRSRRSNGSSSMATVCGTSLSLMDAGAPLKPAPAPASPWA
jgi:polyribonucleotide nucleotidyltransferase